MNDNSDIAFALDIDINEETLLAMTAAVDDLDDLKMIIDGTLFVPDPNTTLEEYVERATHYLVYLLGRLREDDLRPISTMPMDESTRRRIAMVLRSSTRGAQS